MTDTCTHLMRAMLITCALLPLGACRDLAAAPAIPSNPPIARAGADQTLVLEQGALEVNVTLDGTGSTDNDGEVVSYIWLSGDSEEVDGGGIRRSGPDPDNIAMPTITLEQGQWKFVLWVEDDAGRVSNPDVVVITVGDKLPPTAPVQMCMDMSLQSISADCRRCACELDEACMELVPGCDQGCWDMALCTNEKCEGEADRANCARTMCAELIDAAVPYIIDFGPCTEQCPQDCDADAATGGMAEPIPDGPVGECVANTVQTVTEACRLCVCDIDDACRQATTDCNQACWDLEFCAEENCAGLTGGEQATCAREMCGEFIDAPGGIASLAFSPCRSQCPGVCAAAAQ